MRRARRFIPSFIPPHLSIVVLASLGLACLALAPFAPARAQDEAAPKKGKAWKTQKAAAAADLPAVLWRDPGDISSLDLIHGIGGSQDAPGEHEEEYTFVRED